MSAKWRALQHRHRYTYSAVSFPQSYIEALNLLPIDTSSIKYYTELKELISLNSTYAQVNHAKNISLAFGDLLTNAEEESSVSEAARFYLEILFLENSLPLHRTLVSVLAKSKKFQSVVGNCFRLLCDEYGGLNGKGKRFCVSRVALSMMSTPKLGYLLEIVEECAVFVALDIVFGLNSVVSGVTDWSQPSPIVMEQCQESLSCMYYLLQRFPSKFSDSDGNRVSLLGADSNILEMILTTILSVLKSQAFSRDCFVAAGVSFCAALQVCLSPNELSLVIMEGFFCRTKCTLLDSPNSGFGNAVKKIPYKGHLFPEICNFPALGRLCLIRGILTAISRTVLNTPFSVSSDEAIGNSVQTILYDGILPELCNYCENPVDSHFNFHALTVTQICLQQIKTSMQVNIGNQTEDYDPMSEDTGARILKIIWNNLEDPLSQTVKQVHLIFDLFLDIQSSLHWAKDSERVKLFLKKIASDLLCLGPRCKGRYVPLASLTKRLGAKTILDMSPDLLFETTNAYIDDDVCCAATTFLKCFLECLRDECWRSDGIESGYTKYRGYCLPPLLFGLASGVSKLRSNLNTYALPLLLELDVDSIFPMLDFISVGCGGEETELVYPELSCTSVVMGVEQKVAVLVSLLKVSRLLALIEGDIDEEGHLTTENVDRYALFWIKGIKLKVLVEWLVLALTHVDESLRIDAAESLYLNPKTSSLPSHMELSLLKVSVPLNMRCCSTAFQMKWTSLFRKFFSRVRTALERQVKLGNWKPLASFDDTEVRSCNGTEEFIVDRAGDLLNFMKWLSSFLFFSCYPSAPYERKIMAMELIMVMISVWSIVPPVKCDSVSSEVSLYPYNRGFTSPESTLMLVVSIIDSWDRLREGSFRILLHFPTPLPGISSQDMVRKIIIWAKKLVCSPRVRESDAGAITLRLIFRKYVLEHGWIIKSSCDNVSFHLQHEIPDGVYQNCTYRSPVIEHVRSLIDWLQDVVEEGEKDLSESCRNSFVHGVLLTLRYTFEELDWNSNIVLANISEMRHLLEKLLELVMRITSLALWVVSADALHLPEDMDDMADDVTFLSEAPVDIDSSVSESEHEVKTTKLLQDVGPSEQIVMVGCWLAMKEVSLLLGTIIRKIPLPTSELLKPGEPFCDDSESTMTSNIVLDLKQLEIIGNHFLEVLLKMKHNGAIDKTRAGFTALCNRLLCSNDPRLCKLTDSWMEELMERTVARGQTVDDLLRRSAGIPAAFTALFLSEPEGTPKRLLPRALRWLIDIASGSLLDQIGVNRTNGDSYISSSTKPNQVIFSPAPPEMHFNEKTSKIRDEGVVPTVHAFNVLKAAFNDTNLATDTSGFSAEALIISIRSFSSSYWEVRNSACLAYTALVRRMIGFLNVQKRESARRALTGLEFFHRYPSLHPFLFNELKVATQMLGNRSSGHPGSNLANAVHPSLCPMLIILSRLKPSTITSEAGDALDPFLFMPFIRRCSIQSNLRVRVLASRALAGLVSNEKLPAVLLNIASELPCSENQMMVIPESGDPVIATNGTPLCASFNSIHGMLLQLISLLDNNCRNLIDFLKKDQIIGDLIQVLRIRSWIGIPRLCPCPIVNGCFLRVLDNMLSIARSCHLSKNIDAIWNLLCELSSKCLDVETSHGPTYYDPTIAELRKQAVVSYFNCVFQASKEVAEEEDLPLSQTAPLPCSQMLVVSENENAFSAFRERLTLSMSDSSYEVRIATLKWLLRFVKATESGKEATDQSNSEIGISCWIKSNLQSTLMKLLEVEKNHKCKYHILQILFTWNLLQFQKLNSPQSPAAVYVGNMVCDSVFRFWEKLVSLYELTRHAKTRKTLLCCMGICVKRFMDLYTSSVLSDKGKKKTDDFCKPDHLGSSSHLYNCISYYVDLIEQHSASSEPVNMRKAAAESMVASGLLEKAELIGSSVVNNQIPSENSCSKQIDDVNRYAYRILDIWFTCIKLLEDEDDGLRSKLAVDIQKCFTSRKSERNSGTGLVPTQVEKVIELSFEHLSAVFGLWLEYFNYLSLWVLNSGNYVGSSGNLVRRVFDKEIDNHHEEKLLVSQICCVHLEKLPVSKSWSVDFPDKYGFRNFLRKWRMRFFHQLKSFANDHIKSGLDWIGGVGNHKDAFLPLYANLLGFYALSNCIFNGEIEDGECLLSDVTELGEHIDPFLRNPLISNLYFLVVRSHERVVGATVGQIRNSRGDDSIWDGFDPYFLIR